MANPIYLYPSLTETMKEGIFQAKNYIISYDNEGFEKELDYELAEVGALYHCLKSDGKWNVDTHNLYFKRSIALKNFKKLFGPFGIASKNSKLGLSVIWTSPDSRQRGAVLVKKFNVSSEEWNDKQDHTFVEADIDIEFPCAKLRGDVKFSIVLSIAEAGKPNDDEIHLANEEGFVLGELDTFVIRIDGNGSLFPVYEVYEPNHSLWHVRCDWTDPMVDPFSETVSININKAHKNFKYIDRGQKTFCAQLLIEVMSAALCCIVEKIRSEKYLDQILSDEEVESGSVGEAIRYFSQTLGWDLSAPDKLSCSAREFFDRRIHE